MLTYLRKILQIIFDHRFYFLATKYPHVLKSQHKYSRKKNGEKTKKEEKKKNINYREFQDHLLTHMTRRLRDDKETSYLMFLYNEVVKKQVKETSYLLYLVCRVNFV